MTHGIEAITRTIPHRYPSLKVDRVLDIEPGRRITTIKAVTCNEPCYSHPVTTDAATADYAYPMSEILESWGQSAALLICWADPCPNVLAHKVFFMGTVTDAVLGVRAYPGDVLRHEVSVVRPIGADDAIVTGRTLIRDDIALTLDNCIVARRPLIAPSVAASI